MPKVLFAAPNHFGFYSRIIKEFEYYNYNVVSICIEDWPEKRVNKNNRHLRRCLSFFKRQNKKKLHKKGSELISFLNQFKHEHFDYCLFIRPDFYSLEVIQKSISLSKKSLAYQWDGLNRYPNIKDKINLFDNFLVFDKSDYDKYHSLYPNINIGCNFYFENDKKINPKKSIDVFYLGAFEVNRNAKMMKMYNVLANLDVDIKIVLCQIPLQEENINKFTNNDIKFTDKIMDYTETLSYTMSAKIIIDLLVEEHSGLSFRFFEAMKYKNKIITTNTSIKNYEFYHPNNIFVFEEDNLNQLKYFINKPYQELKNVDQYSFINWFKKHNSSN